MFRTTCRDAAVSIANLLNRDVVGADHVTQRNGALFRSLALEHGLETGTGAGTAICPVMVADSLPAVILSQRLLERGINVQPVMHPAVPAKASRLRFFLTTKHTDQEMATAVRVTAEELASTNRKLPSLSA